MPSYLQELLSISKKRELRKFVRGIEITKRDFVTLVWNAPSIGYGHDIQYHQFLPEGVGLNIDLLRGPDKEQRVRNLKTVVGQLNTVFEQRRLLTAHIFINDSRWHVFYFDQRDQQPDQWAHGPHMRFVNFLWPNYDPFELWETLKLAETRVQGKLHIRYDPQEPETPAGSPLPLP